MAAITSNAVTGNWSSTSSWVGGVVPGVGDTATIVSGATITVNVNTTVGTSPAAGTNVLVVNNGGNLLLAVGVQLNVRGDTLVSYRSIVMAHGSKWYFDGSVGLANYKLKLDDEGSTTNEGVLICNGTSGDHCVVGSTSPSYPGSIGPATSYGGHVQATYTDFSYLGTASVDALEFAGNSYPTGNTWANCTFDHCGLFHGTVAGFTETISLTDVIFSNSVNTSLGLSAFFENGSNQSGSSRQILRSTFDKGLWFNDAGVYTFTDNYVGNTGANLYTASSLAMTPTNCLVVSHGGGSPRSLVNCYIYSDLVTDNIHFTEMPNSAPGNYVYDRCVSEAPAMTAITTQGKAFLMPTANSIGRTVTVTRCLALPSLAGHCHMVLFGFGDANLTSIVAEHNTVISASTEPTTVVACWIGDTYNPPAGWFSSWRANLAYSTISGQIYQWYNNVGSPASDVIPAGFADYNATYNGAAGSAAKGYQGAFSVAPGAHDLFNTQDPRFADTTAVTGLSVFGRNLRRWGKEVAGVAAGGDNYLTNTLAYLQANPSTIATGATSLTQWVRAGHAPTNSAFQAASYPGDTSTVDAAGTAWPGGAPGIGAMGRTAGGSLAPLLIISGGKAV